MGEKLFGRNYESVGKDGSDFLIKTKGKVKIKWGNKYIDLVKDGKINVDAKIFRNVETEDDVATSSGNGIFITNDGKVFIKFGDTIIPIVQDASSSNFVSFELQEGKTGEEKMNAQKNIGILAETIDELTSYEIQSGLAYVSSEDAIYIISNGIPNKLEFTIPNPITNPVHVLVDKELYSMLLEGYFSENGNKLIIGNEADGIEIYAERENKYIDSSTSIIIKIKDRDILTISDDDTILNSNLIIGNDKTVVTDTIRNDGGSKDTGYWLGMDSGESYLYVDNIVVRNDPNSFIDTDYDNLISMIENEELKPGKKYRFKFMNEWDILEEREEDSVQDGLFLNKNVYRLVVTAISNTELSKDAYFYEYPQWKLEYDPTSQDIDDGEGGTMNTYGRITRMIDEYGNEANFDFKHLRFHVDGEWKFLFQFVNEKNQKDASEDDGVTNMVVSGDGSCTGEIKNTVIEADFENLQRTAFPGMDYTIGGNITLQMKGTFNNCTFKTFKESAIVGVDDGASNDSKIIADEINGCEINCEINGCEVIYDTINKIEIDGSFDYNKMQGATFSQTINGMKYCYVSGQFEDNTLPDNIIQCYFRGDIQGQNLTLDGSGIFTDGKPTDIYVWDGELRTIRMPDTIFPGMIVMYDGRKPVPTGWTMCDGGNGTPNLIDKFVKAGTVAGEEGGKNEQTLEVANLPSHDHYVSLYGTTSTDGAHSHTVNVGKGLSDNADDRDVVLPSGSTSTSTDGDHSHTVSVSGYTFNTGDGEPFNNQPEYYTLIFIMYIGYSENYY